MHVYEFRIKEPDTAYFGWVVYADTVAEAWWKLYTEENVKFDEAEDIYLLGYKVIEAE